MAWLPTPSVVAAGAVVEAWRGTVGAAAVVAVAIDALARRIAKAGLGADSLVGCDMTALAGCAGVASG